MKPVLNAEQMRAWDQATITGIGVPSAVLMERAALAVAEAAAELAGSGKRILCLCGTGNNGGDGAAAARILSLRGYDAAILLVGSRDKLSPDMKEQMAIAGKLGIPCLTPDGPVDLSGWDVLIDAIFGIGLVRDIEDRYGIFEAVNRSGVPVVSADIPSGISADTGAVMGRAIKASVTVAIQALKAGHLFYPGAAYCGRVITAEIGIVPRPDKTTAHILEDSDLRTIPARDPCGNKGTFGKILVVAGSKNMSGASFLTCLAALKTGCGMVKLLTAEENRIVIQETLPEVMLETYADDEEAADALLRGLTWADVIACGPGLGTGSAAETLVRTLLLETDKPLVLDADALNLISRNPAALKACSGPVLITPHPGEMARLTGLGISDITENLIDTASAFSREYGVTCLLKDARTCTADPAGRVFINTSGNSGMATAGSGDVLTGICAALIARGLDPACAGPLGAYIHGKAGDIAARKAGPSALTATSLITELPYALGEITYETS